MDVIISFYDSRLIIVRNSLFWTELVFGGCDAQQQQQQQQHTLIYARTSQLFGRCQGQFVFCLISFKANFEGTRLVSECVKKWPTTIALRRWTNVVVVVVVFQSMTANTVQNFFPISGSSGTTFDYFTGICRGPLPVPSAATRSSRTRPEPLTRAVTKTTTSWLPTGEGWGSTANSVPKVLTSFKSWPPTFVTSTSRRLASCTPSTIWAAAKAAESLVHKESGSFHFHQFRLASQTIYNRASKQSHLFFF